MRIHFLNKLHAVFRMYGFYGGDGVTAGLVKDANLPTFTYKFKEIGMNHWHFISSMQPLQKPTTKPTTPKNLN